MKTVEKDLLKEFFYVTVVKKNILKCMLDQISIMITASYQELDVKYGFHFKTRMFYSFLKPCFGLLPQKLSDLSFSQSLVLLLCWQLLALMQLLSVEDPEALAPATTGDLNEEPHPNGWGLVAHEAACTAT